MEACKEESSFRHLSSLFLMLHQRDEVVTDIDTTVGTLDDWVRDVVEAFVADDHVLAFAEDYVAAAVEADYAVEFFINFRAVGSRHLFVGCGGSQGGPPRRDSLLQGPPERRHNLSEGQI
jgi:hypothetical protein